MSAIEGFRGEYRFLSNFFRLPEPIVEIYEDKDSGKMIPVKFHTMEHAYQASKYQSLDKVLEVAACDSPGGAKRKGRQYVARPDWESIKLDVMLYFVRKKFQIPYFKERLLATGEQTLYEVNNHGDVFWGTDTFLDGENHLGYILMQVRQELRDQN